MHELLDVSFLGLFMAVMFASAQLYDSQRVAFLSPGEARSPKQTRQVAVGIDSPEGSRREQQSMMGKTEAIQIQGSNRKKSHNF